MGRMSRAATHSQRMTALIATYRSAVRVRSPPLDFAGQRLLLSHTCYSCRMAEVASRDLRNATRSLLDRVAAGERLTITVDGRPVAVLAPVGRRPRWVAKSEFVPLVLANQADASLAADLRELASDTTDDLPLS